MRRARAARGFILLPVVLALTLLTVAAFLLNRDGGMHMSLAARSLQADSARYVAEAGMAQLNAQTQSRNCTGYTDLGTTAFGPHSFTATVNPKSGSPVTLSATAATASGATATLTRSGVVVHQTTAGAATLQPAAAGGADTWISEQGSKQSTNYGADIQMTVATTGIAPGRALIKFDLSSIPAGSSISSATLSLYQLGVPTYSGDPAVNVHRVTSAWVEGTRFGSGTADGATWLTANGATPWSSPGGDFDATAAAARPVDAVVGWKTWDITALVDGWIGGAFPDHGLMLIGSGSIAFLSLASGDHATATQRPTLSVTFYPPCGWVPPPSTFIATRDAVLAEAHTNRNYGASTSVELTANSNDSVIVAQFDLSAVAPGTPFQSARLRFYTSSMSNRTGAPMLLSAYAITRTWVEGTKTGSGSADGATWNTYNGANNWTAAGGDYSTPAAGSVTLPASFASGWFEIDITALTRAWVDGVTANNGTTIRTFVTDRFNINMREAANNRPELVVTY